ncbi:MAG: FtsX-like permease family protein [Christensenellales bacterium]|jgi:putative ABC transport system permease protein
MTKIKKAKKAYNKEVRRSIRKGWRRFLSIAAITALGVTMLTGLYASSMNMYYSADLFYDRQKLFDIRIVSTLGLTDEDLDAIQQMDSVESAELAFSENVYTYVNDLRKKADIELISPSGMNAPHVLEGRLPQAKGEIAVTQKYLSESGKVVGDTLIIEEIIDSDEGDEDGAKSEVDEDELSVTIEEDEETPTFSSSTFVITGVVIHPYDIQNAGGSLKNLRSSGDAHHFFASQEEADPDVFTGLHIVLAGAAQLNSYSQEYEDIVQAAVDEIESQIKAQRELARYSSVFADARGKVEDAESAVSEKLAEAEDELKKAWDEIEEAKVELEDGKKTLEREEFKAQNEIYKARVKLREARKELEEAEEKLADGQAQLQEALKELEESAQELKDGWQELWEGEKEASSQFAAAQQQIDGAQAELDQARAQIDQGTEQLKGAFGDTWPQDEWEALVSETAALAAAGADDQAIAEGTAAQAAALAGALPAQQEEVVQAAIGSGKVEGGQQLLDGQKDVLSRERENVYDQFSEANGQLTAGDRQIADGRSAIDEKAAELEEARNDINNGWDELEKGQQELKKEEAKARDEISKAWTELEDAEREIKEAEDDLISAENEYLEKKQEAEEKLSDAYGKLSDIDMTRWYIQDRSSLASYLSLDSDLSSIDAVGKVFPVIFLLVAVLMSLTAMTRMVEEERGLIGTFKALGISHSAIYGKYLLFSFTACLTGGVLGNIFGFVLFPQLVSAILAEMYVIPEYHLRFDLPYAVAGVLLFVVCVVGSTAMACRNELSRMPAALMRPKAPKAGARVLLEYFPFIWNRLNFLNKVTLRNLFRYKKRLLMTIIGVAGCTALVLCGFAIKDSIADLAPKQYDNIYLYDIMAVFDEDEQHEFFKLTESDEMEGGIYLRIESAKLINDQGNAETVQLMVLPFLPSSSDSTGIPEGAALTGYINMLDVNGAAISPGEGSVLITQNAAQMLGLSAGDSVSLQNMDLASHQVIISQVAQNYLGNNVYITQGLYESLFEPYAPNAMLAHLSPQVSDHKAYADALLENDWVISASSSKFLREDFTFDLINAVVLLLIFMAGGLAFAVLFTLSSTNISERVRELATIKVLGFHDKEVHRYVNRETLILTFIGIGAGLPLGKLISQLLTLVLHLPSIHFASHIEPHSYAISAAITLCFALIVNLISKKVLNKIDMVEALKSAE